MTDRETIQQRVAAAGLGTNRYIDVEDGSKRSYDHDTKYDRPPRGNYGIYAKAVDGLVLVDIDDYEELPDKSGLAALADLPATLEQESAHGGTHKLYRVGATDDGRLVAKVLEETFGTMNPTPSWGEVRVANQYIVGAGSELDDGCRYSVQADREIATVAASDLVDVLAADPEMEREDIDPVDSDNVDESVEVPDSVDDRLEYALETDEKLARLWRGDYSDYGGDRSRAESALACKLAFWVGQDKRTVADLLDRANTQKWADREDDSYRSSVLAAVDVQSDTFEPRSPKPKSGAVEAAESGPQTDGSGTTTETSSTDGACVETPIEDRVRSFVLTPLDPPEDSDIEQITNDVAIDRFADLLMDEYRFVRPRSDVRGWRDTLYNYVPEDGIYEPHGHTTIAEECERLLGAWSSNQRVKEITEKIARQCQMKPGEFDTDPNRLVVGNGIVDLHDGTLTGYTPDEYHRTKIDVDWNPQAETGFIDDFLADVTRGDKDTLYRAIAHCLYKEYVAEKAVMLLGDGQNGKSVFLSLVEQFLGTENVSHRALQDFDDNDYAANNLEGKLANIHPDMGDESVSDLGTFKKLTGRDIMTADVKYERPITFENHASLLFAANRMPVLEEDTHALWRRWVYVNFPYRFDDSDPSAKDETPKRVLMRKLTATEELEGLLVRCVEEIQAWWEGRAWYPDVPSPDQVREKMKRASEPVYDFAVTCLTEDDDGWLCKDDVRQAYRDYARDEGLPTIPDNRFGEQLLNIRDYKIEGGRRREDGQRVQVYNGIAWTSRGRQVAGLDDDADEGQSGLDDTEAESIRAAVRDVLAAAANGEREVVLVAKVAKRGEWSPEAIQDRLDQLVAEGRLIDRDDDRVRLQ